MNWFQAPRPLLPELIVRHGRWRAARPALIAGQQRLSWSEFERDTGQIANGLAAQGLEGGARIAVLMDNSLECALVLFGILRSGCVAVPLNTSITDQAVAAMIEDAGARAICASNQHCARIDALAPVSAAVRTALCIGHRAPSGRWLELVPWYGAQPVTPPQVQIEPHDLCNIIYSSGTTGTPKGIVHSHACRLAWATELALVLRYRSDCVTLCSLGLFSNISWVAMLATILVGGTIVVMEAFEARAAAALIERERITHGTFVPLQLEQLLALEDFSEFRLDSLDTVMCCGSPLPLAVKREFPSRAGCQLIELYGLTEGVCTILAPEDFETKTASVGKPFLGTDLKILDDQDREVATGTTGEIVGRGALLMQGYYNREEASREATWTDAYGARWLRTGDLGQLDEEGFLYIVDRKKDMILSGGQNIYPADIEQVMRERPEIAEVAVVAARSRKWGETPVAFVVFSQGPQPERTDLLQWTNARVGRQQRIADVIICGALPRNANGKVLKRELRRQIAGTEY
ncbi:MAG TPA: class I adenylate-forming enzyme family protein [Mycobacterium sp.]|nr:class I adenylate-forming enzyme family protein [Mycobacterium sp.]